MAAKKKWGPLKTGCFGILAILGVILLWLCYAAYWSFTAVPGSGNEAAIRIDQLIADNQPKGGDGAGGSKAVLDTIELYKKEEAAFKADHPARQTQSGLFSRPQDAIEFETFGQTGAPEADTERTRLFLDRLKKSDLPAALATVAAHSAFARPIAERAKSEQLSDVLLPDLTRLRALTRYNSARMFVAAKEGDEQEVVASFDSTLGLARSTAYEPIFLSRLMAIQLVSTASSDLRTTLVEHRLSQATLNALVASLNRQTIWPSLDLSIEGERAFAHHRIQESFTDDGSGDGRFIAMTSILFSMGPPIGGESKLTAQLKKLQNIFGFFVAGKKSTIALVDELCDQFVTYSRKTAVARRASGKPVRELGWLESRRFPILLFIQPVFERTAIQEGYLETTLAGTRLMLAIEQFRAQRGTYPAALDELAPDFLAAVPTDPHTGTPYGYIKHDSPDEFGRGYLLYSYGNNFTDDGGAFDENSNFLARTRAASDQPLDWILNAPRETYQPPE